jgi:hypothetical protein
MQLLNQEQSRLSSLTAGVELSPGLLGVFPEFFDYTLSRTASAPFAADPQGRAPTAKASGLTPFSIRDMQIDNVCRSRSAFWSKNDQIDTSQVGEKHTRRVEISWKTSMTCRACAAFSRLSCLPSGSEGILVVVRGDDGRSR